MTIPPRSVPRPAVALAVGAVVLGSVLGGCSKTETTVEKTVTPATPSASAGVSATLPAIPGFKGKATGAVADVKVVKCPTEKGEQTVELALTNSTKKARDYAIMVIWLKNDSGNPLGATMVTAKDAEPGKKTELSGKAKVLAKADRCVLNVQAGDLK